MVSNIVFVIVIHEGSKFLMASNNNYLLIDILLWLQLIILLCNNCDNYHVFISCDVTAVAVILIQFSHF